VTALCDFEQCPMLFHWRYELGVPEKFLRGTGILPVRGEAILASPDQVAPVNTSGNSKDAAGTAATHEGETPVPRSASSLDAATAGTVFHRCMELLDFRAEPATDDALKLVQRVLAEMGIQEQTDAAGLAAELEEMLVKLRSHEIWTHVRDATRVDRELSFVTQAPGLVLRGQIDLIYRDGAGAWHIVDYKSNRIGAEGIAPHAAQYELQMMVYALAAKGHVGAPPAEATLYFLRVGQSHAFPITPDSCAQALKRVAKLAAELALARRGGNYERRRCDACAYCQYQPLCHPQISQICTD
jgi:RecB family exonuclease